MALNSSRTLSSSTTSLSSKGVSPKGSAKAARGPRATSKTKVQSSKAPARTKPESTKAARDAAVSPAIRKSAKSASHIAPVDVPALRTSLKSTLGKGLSVAVKTAGTPSRKTPKAEDARPARARVRTRRSNDLVASEIAQAMMGEMEAVSEDSVLARQAAKSQRERVLLSRLAISMARSDDMPNLELAAELVEDGDHEAVGILVGTIERHDVEHAPDAARVLSEVGTRAPDLLLAQAERLLSLCDSSQKSVLPYTMFALAPIAHHHVDTLWDMRELLWAPLADLTQPADMAQAGAVRLLASLCAAGPDYARTLAGGLVDLLGKCMPKDVAFFAESVLPALGTAHSHRAKPVLDRRMKELTPAEVARLRRAVRAAQTGQPIYAAA